MEVGSMPDEINSTEHPLETSSASSGIGTAVKAIASAIPGLGGPLSSLIGDLQSMRKEARLIEFLEGLKSDIDGLETRVNEDFISNEDFLDIFETTARHIATTRQEDKREAFRHIISNALISSDITYDEAEEFLRLLNKLRPEHIFLLKVLLDSIAFDESTGSRVGLGGGLTTSINQIMTTLLTGWPEQDIREVLGDLEREALAHGLLSRYNTMMTDQGVNHLTGALTRRGKKFCEFLLSPR
jgi:hypothetical protein